MLLSMERHLNLADPVHANFWAVYELKEVREMQIKLTPFLTLLKTQPRERPAREPLQPLNPTSTAPQEEEPLSLDITQMAIETRRACSVGNYAVHLVRNVFSAEELAGKNWNGFKEKNTLNKAKLKTVKRLVLFCYCDIPLHQQEYTWNVTCVRAIDEYLRRPNRARAQLRLR